MAQVAMVASRMVAALAGEMRVIEVAEAVVEALAVCICCTEIRNNSRK